MRRWDTLAALVQKIAQSVFFFNPLIWLANWMIDQQREFACDDIALAACGTPRLDCGQGFLSLALRCSHRSQYATSVLGLFNFNSLVRRRMMRILDTQRKLHAGLSAGAMVFLLGAALVILPPVRAGEKQTIPENRMDMSPIQNAAGNASMETSPSAANLSGPAMSHRRLPENYFPDNASLPSPNGNFVAGTDWRTGNLVLRDLTQKTTVNLTHKASWDESSEYALYPSFSPDGKQVAYAWNNATYSWINKKTVSLRVVNVDGSNPRILYQEEILDDIKPVQWSPEGKQILAIMARKEKEKPDVQNHIALVSVADGSIQIIKSLGVHKSNCGFSPDARYIAYHLPAQPGVSGKDIYILSLADKQEGILEEHPADDQFVGWSPDGRWILFTSDRSGSKDLWAAPVAEGKRQGDSRLILNGIGEIEAKGFTKNGSFYYEALRIDTDIYVTKLDLAAATIIDSPRLLFQNVESRLKFTCAWSHDGQYLAAGAMRSIPFSSMPPKPAEILIQSIRTGDTHTLNTNLIAIVYICWSHDDQSIYAEGLAPSEDGSFQFGLYQIDRNTGTATPALKSQSNFVLASFDSSPDGKFIYYICEAEKQYRIVRYDCEANKEQEIYTNLDLYPSALALSKDGKWIAFKLGNVGASMTLNIIPASGGEIKELYKYKSTLNVFILGSFEWSPDGQRVFFTEPAGEKGTELLCISKEGGPAQKVAESYAKAEFIFPRISPDGQYIAYCGGSLAIDNWVLENFLPKE